MYYSISETKIAAVNELGMVEQVYDLGNYQLHHDYVFDDDGNLLILATDTGKQTVEDCVLKLNPSTGEVSCILDLGIWTGYISIPFSGWEKIPFY